MFDMLDKVVAVLFNSDIAFVVQLYSAVFLVFFEKERKKLGILYLLFGLGVTLLVSVFWKPHMNSNGLYVIESTIRYTILFILCSLTTFFAYRCSISETIFLITFAYTMQHMATSISWLIALGLFKEFVLEKFIRLQYFNYGCCLIVYLLLYFTLIKRIKRQAIKLDVLFLSIPSAIILFASMIMNLALIQLRLEHPVLQLYHIAFCLVIFFFLSGLFRNSELSKENEYVTHMLDLQKKHSELSKESINLINIKCHDMKKQLETINRISSESSLIEYKHDIEKSLDDYDSIANTGNDALDIALTERVIYSKSKNIKLSYMADGKLIGFMSDADIYSMFGNALDNAMEAVIKLPEEKRIIDVLIKKEKNLLNIHFSNYYSGKIVMKNGIPVTGKNNTVQHGFGIKSIKMIAEKYGGTAAVSFDDEFFNLDILFPNR